MPRLVSSAAHGGPYTVISPHTYKWRFADVYEKGPQPYIYDMQINPNDGGSPTITKNIEYQSNTGPNRQGIVQEGQNQAPTISFSGIILSQAQYEAMELWYDKRILIGVLDDLNRYFEGVFSAWSPKRSRRASNVWYHTYDATMTLTTYVSASGRPTYTGPRTR